MPDPPKIKTRMLHPLPCRLVAAEPETRTQDDLAAYSVRSVGRNNAEPFVPSQTVLLRRVGTVVTPPQPFLEPRLARRRSLLQHPEPPLHRYPLVRRESAFRKPNMTAAWKGLSPQKTAPSSTTRGAHRQGQNTEAWN